MIMQGCVLQNFIDTYACVPNILSALYSEFYMLKYAVMSFYVCNNV